ncbi:cytochrome c [Marinovum sp.]|uniref:c-type cytochrome n=1 Tax=Marinovum sp. TaxID=2024839 RepID=UPI002B27B926|nr:cytochrome c [Marinovum sp.]
MKKIVTVLAAAAILSGGATVAQEYKNQIKARQGTMWVIALNLGTLGGMAKGETEYDAEAATMAAESIQAASNVHFASLFPEGSDGEMNEGSTAKPTIAGDLAGFNEKWAALGAAADKAVAEVGTGTEALGPVMGALGGACKSCHETYRIPQ